MAEVRNSVNRPQAANAALVTRGTRKITRLEEARELVRRAISAVSARKDEAPRSGLRTGIALAAGAFVLSTVASELPKATPAQNFEAFANRQTIRRDVGSLAQPLSEPPLFARILGIPPAYAEQFAITQDTLVRQGIYLNGNQVRVGGTVFLGLTEGDPTGVRFQFPNGETEGYRNFGFDGSRGFSVSGTLVNGVPHFYLVGNGSRKVFGLVVTGKTDVRVVSDIDFPVPLTNPCVAVANRYYLSYDGGGILCTRLATGERRVSFYGVTLDPILKNEGIRESDIRALTIAAANNPGESNKDYLLVTARGFKYLYVYAVEYKGENLNGYSADCGAIPVAQYIGGPIPGRPRIHIGKNPETGNISCIVLDIGTEDLLVYNREARFERRVQRKEMGYATP